MPDYSRLAASAKRQIAAAGLPVTLTRNVVDDYDPTRGMSSTLGDRSWKGVAARDQYALRDIDGTLIRTGDLRLYLVITLDDGSLPQAGDILTLDDGAWNIQRVTPIKPGSVVLLYDVQARK